MKITQLFKCLPQRLDFSWRCRDLERRLCHNIACLCLPRISCTGKRDVYYLRNLRVPGDCGSWVRVSCWQRKVQGRETCSHDLEDRSPGSRWRDEQFPKNTSPWLIDSCLATRSSQWGEVYKGETEERWEGDGRRGGGGSWRTLTLLSLSREYYSHCESLAYNSI